MPPSPAAAIAMAHRLFFALLPPPDVATAIGGQRRVFGVTRSPVADHRLHLTLAISNDFPDALPDVVLGAAMRAGEAIRADRFRLLLDQAVGSGKSVALQPSETLPGLSAFQRQLATRLGREDFAPRAGWRFSPHVTLGYRRGAPFVQQILPISWRATDFALIHSHVGLTRHDLLARWPLREP